MSKISRCIDNWHSITNNKQVLECVEFGVKVPFTATPPACEYGLDLDLDHIVATSLRILTATVLDSDEMLGPLEEKLCPQKLSVEFLPYGFASAQKMFFFTEWPCHAHESNWS